jgi:hypothetical protein
MINSKNIRIGLVASAVVFGGLLLVSGTGISLGTLLLIGLFALCPLMMLGMHGGGHQHGGDTTSQPTQPTDPDSRAAIRPHVH